MRRFGLWLTSVMLLSCITAYSQTPLQLNTISTQNFNSIGSSSTASLPANWKMSSVGTGATSGYATGTNITVTTQAANSGLPSAGGAYNWATTGGTDRAVGFMTTASYVSPNSIIAWYRNATGATVNSVTISFAIERYVVNTATISVSLFSSTDGSSWTAQTSGDISTSDFAAGANAGTFGTPKTINKTVAIPVTVSNNGDIYFRWVFSNTGSTAAQGLGLDDVSVFAGTATPVIVATLKDILQVDNGTLNQFNQGDVIRYQTVVKNTGTGDATGVQVTLPTPPANTTMVAGSVKTSAVAVDDNYGASFNTILNGSTVLANDIGIPSPTTVITYGATNNIVVSPGTATITDAGGTITLAANGTFTYTPPTGFSGIDKFKYITGNGNLPNNDAVVTITVGADVTFTTTNMNPLCNGGSTGSIVFNAGGGNGSLTYSITGSGGTYQASNSFNGLAAGTYNLAVKDVGGLIKTGTATLTDPAAIVVSGNILKGSYNDTMTATVFTRTGGTGGVTWSATGLPAGVTINSSTGQINGIATQTGSFTGVITATDINGCTGIKTISFSVTPQLFNDTYLNLVGNTQLVADAYSTPGTPYIASATNILSNDASDAPLTVVAVTNATTTLGGTITIATNGKFIYTPPAGVTGIDYYTYSAMSNGVSATAVIALPISNMVWYVNNTYIGVNGAANGSSHRPFIDVASAITASPANQIIYVHTGTGSTTGNATLKTGQILRGAGSALTVGSLSIAAGTKPTLSGTLTLANNVTADGFDMNTGSATAIISSGATSVNIVLGNITASGATPVTLTNTTGTIVIAGGTLTGGAGTVFNVSGGSATITNGAAITQANAQRIINIANASGGTITFSGNITGTSTNTGINLATNTGATVNFTGSITLNGTASVLSATGGGTLNITGSSNTIGNTIAPAAAAAVAITNTAIGTSGIRFKSVSANGAANGIYLFNTGSTGGFVVTGDGINWGSGGTIQNSTGTDGATAGNGIFLSNAYNVAFNFMLLNGHSNNGVYGTGVRGFTLNKSRFTGSHGTSNSGTYDESDISLVDLGGAVSIKNSYFSGGAYNTVRIENSTGTNPVITSLQMDTDTLTGMQGSTADVRSTALLLSLMDGSITTGTIQSCRIDSWWGNAIHVLSQGTASATVTITGNYCNNTNGALAGAGGIWVSGGTLDYTISGNTVLNTNGTAISADRVNFGSLMRGSITGNSIGASGVPNSGSATGIAIFASHHGNQTTTTTISNNIIRQVNGSANGAITALMGDDFGYGDAGGGSFNVSILNNNIQESGTTVNNAQHGILLTVGVTSSGATGGDNGVGCFNIQGNVITNFISGTATNRIRVNQRFKTTARFPGYAGAQLSTQSATDLANYLLARNSASTSTNANTSTGGFNNTTGGVPCTQ